MKIMIRPLLLIVLFGSLACGRKMTAAPGSSEDRAKAKASAVPERSLLAYYDGDEEKKWVHSSLASKKADSHDPQQWRPRNDTLANIYQNVLDTAKISPIAIYNTFRYFEDNRGKILSTEVCTSLNLSSKDYEKLDIKKSIIRVLKKGFVDARVCWNIRHQLREDSLAIADYANVRSSKERMIVVDLNRDADNIVQFVRVSHGMKSGKAADYATAFSNEVSSHQSSQGFYAGYTRYNGANGESLRLLGLGSTNSEAYNRNIVIHSASYVANGGRSHGCPAVEPKVLQDVFDSLEDGRFIADWYDRSKVAEDYVSLGGLLHVYDGQQIYRGNEGETMYASL